MGGNTVTTKDVEQIGPGTVFKDLGRSLDRVFIITGVKPLNEQFGWEGYYQDSYYSRPVYCQFTKNYLLHECSKYWLVKL